MTNTLISARTGGVGALLIVAFASSAFAQQTLQPSAPVQIGDTTRSLLALQASGKAAGPVHPMLGDEASASYARYIDSFSHPIPAQLGSSVGETGSGSGGSSGSGGGAQN